MTRILRKKGSGIKPRTIHNRYAEILGRRGHASVVGDKRQQRRAEQTGRRHVDGVQAPYARRDQVGGLVQDGRPQGHQMEPGDPPPRRRHCRRPAVGDGPDDLDSTRARALVARTTPRCRRR
ncbi:MAG: hypothetical protein ACRD1K_04380 [Acidimicrobiales bacterium]